MHVREAAAIGVERQPAAGAGVALGDETAGLAAAGESLTNPADCVDDPDNGPLDPAQPLVKAVDTPPRRHSWPPIR
jgi:hypothetical protein